MTFQLNSHHDTLNASKFIKKLKRIICKDPKDIPLNKLVKEHGIVYLTYSDSFVFET
jgi:hypothetical protein